MVNSVSFSSTPCHAHARLFKECGSCAVLSVPCTTLFFSNVDIRKKRNISSKHVAGAMLPIYQWKLQLISMQENPHFKLPSGFLWDGYLT